MKQAIEKNTKVLALFAIACTTMVSLVSWLTKDTIIEQQELQLLNTLHQVIPPERLDNNLSQDCQFISDAELLGSKEPHIAYLARKDNLPVAVALTTTAPDGYNGRIEVLVAINVDGTVNGVRILNHQETPGLGDKIEIRKDDWVYSFEGKTIAGPEDSRWAVKKDGGVFDQFTGATITPRAVVKAVKNALVFFEKNKTSLLANTESCRGSNE
ncbi:electron transport complex subunit RsxG [Thalassotalea aquiviva]|uniref:electron transport complex subunit RsxG n=1 Tax=Thalassotalea aquiviva TaxID=3242415 RepID=UPI00352A2EEE